uniref:hypothetical protein n=1 Tax=Rothia nasimurium TaxID=85336 RepID=UPI001F42BF55
MPSSFSPSRLLRSLTSRTSRAQASAQPDSPANTEESGTRQSQNNKFALPAIPGARPRHRL